MFIPEYNKEEKQNYSSNLRLVISGSSVEFYHFSHSIIYGSRFKKGKDEDKDDLKQEKLIYTMSEEEKSLSSARRAKRNLRRIIKSNAWEWLDRNDKPYLPIILTLTFRDDIRNIEQANSIFSNFIQKLNYSVNKVERGAKIKKDLKKNLLKYSSVIEFQDKNRGGVIHYHVIFYNLPKMTKIYDRLASIWGKGYFWVGGKSKGRRKGFSCINSTERLNKTIEYFTKYITKSFDDKRLKNKKKYFNSRELIKPIEVEVEELIEIVVKKIPDESLDYGADDLKYKYKLRERSFNYKRFDLDNYPEELEDILQTIYRYQ